jgi:hypothetical protein
MHSLAVKILFLAFLICIPVFSTQVIAYGEDGSYSGVYDVFLNATVTDKDNDLMSVSFYWGNYTSGDYLLLADFIRVENGTCLSVFLPDCLQQEIIVDGVSYNVTWLEHNYRYEWFLVGYDGKNVTLVQNTFDTCKAWDLNLDKTVNLLDLSLMSNHYNDMVLPPGAQPWDINEDTFVDYLDLSIIVNHYGESY